MVNKSLANADASRARRRSRKLKRRNVKSALLTGKKRAMAAGVRRRSKKRGGKDAFKAALSSAVK